MNKYKTSLRKRPQYGEMINEVELDQPKLKYPDRKASFLRNTQYLSRFDGDKSFISLEEQETSIAKAQFLQQEYRRIARETGTTRATVEMQTQTNTMRPVRPNTERN